MPFQININLDLELSRLLGAYEAIVPSSVMRELRALQKKNEKNSKIYVAVKSALKLSERYRIVDTEHRGDESIIALAQKLNAVVVTNDKELQNRLRAKNIVTISLKKWTHLEIDRSKKDFY